MSTTLSRESLDAQQIARTAFSGGARTYTHTRARTYTHARTHRDLKTTFRHKDGQEDLLTLSYISRAWTTQTPT